MIGEITEYLKDGYLVAIGDKHSSPLARMLIQKLIELKCMDILFIEFANNLGSNGVRLMEYLEQKKTRNSNLSWKLIAHKLRKHCFFKGLSQEDASPTLLDLAAMAASNGIKVGACDLNTDDALQKIEALRTLHQCNLEVGKTALFDNDGFTVRDEFAAAQIANYISKNRGLKSVMLWGDRHFTNYQVSFENFGVVSNTSLLRQLEMQRHIYKVHWIPFDRLIGQKF